MEINWTLVLNIILIAILTVDIIVNFKVYKAKRKAPIHVHCQLVRNYVCEGGCETEHLEPIDPAKEASTESPIEKIVRELGE